MVNISTLYEKLANKSLKEETMTLKGWVKTNRNNGTIGFIEFNDGSAFKGIQIVYEKGKIDNFAEVDKLRTGAALMVVGELVLTPTMKQPFELHATKIELVGDVSEDYPLQKKRHTPEFLREIAHLRPRTNTHTALFRVRSELSFALHKYFHENGFIYVHTPIITANDAEGAGNVFDVITDNKNPHAFFGKKASLTVSGQLHVEPFALTFGKVYTFGPTFRAEESNTTRHAAEFWMLEPEMAFTDLSGNMDVIEESIKYAVNYILEKCPDEVNFFTQFYEAGLKSRLEALVRSNVLRLTYTKAIEILLEAQQKGTKFVFDKIYWGMDLASEHERYLCEVYTNGPVFVTDYPKEIKAFYMRLNDDNKTVAACDLLVPGVGELVGGSQREDRYELLKAKMIEGGNLEDLEWYLDLRKYGGTPHSGFGIGFDRLLMYVTGVTNIRDVQPYARAFGSIKY